LKKEINIYHLLDDSFGKIYKNIDQLLELKKNQKGNNYENYLRYEKLKKELVEELKALEFFYKGSILREK